MPEPTPIRDVGPFTDAAQARAQYDAQTFGIPDVVEAESGPLLVLAEAALLTGLELTAYEVSELRDLSGPRAAIVAGLMLRAHRNGKDGQR